jgi:hypothetical protein
MSERRAIATNIWDDEFVGSLTHFERLLWIGLFTSADDQGRLIHNSLLIQRKIFLYDEDITPGQVEAAIEKFGQAGAGKVFIYEAKGKKLLQLVNWWDYQTLQWPQDSKYPPPEGWVDRVKRKGKDGKVSSRNWDCKGGFAVADLLMDKPMGIPMTIGEGIGGDIGIDIGGNIEDGIEGGQVEVEREGESEKEVRKESEKEVEVEVEDKNFNYYSDFWEKTPKTPFEASKHPAIRVYFEITSRLGTIEQYKAIIDSERLILGRLKCGQMGLIKYLRPFYKEWISRKNANGSPYDKNWTTWLVEWAVNGEIPLRKNIPVNLMTSEERHQAYAMPEEDEQEDEQEEDDAAGSQEASIEASAQGSETEGDRS